MSAAANRMAAKVAESATKAVGKAAQSGSSGSGGAKKGPQTVLQKGAKKDPELYVRNYYPVRRVRNFTDTFEDPSYHHDRRLWACWLSLRYVTLTIQKRQELQANL